MSQPAKQAGEGPGTSFYSFADGLFVQRQCQLNAVFYHSPLADLLPHMITPATKLNSSLRATYVLLYPETARFRHLRKGRKRVIYVAKCNVHVHFLLFELKTCNLCLFRPAPRLPVVGRKYSYKAT